MPVFQRLMLLILGCLVLGNAPANTVRGNAIITIHLAPEGMVAAIILDRPATALTFADPDVVREDDFKILTSGLVLKGNEITSEKPFRRVDLRIEPMKKERDAKYPAHFRLGEGGVLYVPALELDGSKWKTTIDFVRQPGLTRYPDKGDVMKGFVFIGPVELLSHPGRVVVVADPATPPWLVEDSKTTLIKGVDFFSRALASELPRDPLLIVYHDEMSGPDSVADVTPGAITVLRYHGARWRERDEIYSKAMQRVIFHEAFHFWNGGSTKFSDGTPAWLHEGGAEYASVLGAFQTGILSEADVLGRLTDALSQCRNALQKAGDKGLAEFEFLPADVRYPCGMTIQWAADLHLRRGTRPNKNILDAWRQVIGTANKRPKKEYDLTDFGAAIGVKKINDLIPVRLLVDTHGSERWNQLSTALNELGADVQVIETASTRRSRLMFHLYGQVCKNLPAGSNTGYSLETGQIRLNTPKECGVLGGDPTIASIENGSALDLSADTFAKAQAKCAAKQAVTLKTADGKSIEVPCTKSLEPAAKTYVVTRWLPTD